jgi:hypothetical protein
MIMQVDLNGSIPTMIANIASKEYTYTNFEPKLIFRIALSK